MIQLTHYETPLIRKLASEFCRELIGDLHKVGATIYDVARDNDQGGHTMYNKICCTHDYIDSNETMLKARENIGLEPLDASSVDDAALCNAAWQLAKLTGFTYREK